MECLVFPGFISRFRVLTIRRTSLKELESLVDARYIVSEGVVDDRNEHDRVRHAYPNISPEKVSSFIQETMAGKSPRRESLITYFTDSEE